MIRTLLLRFNVNVYDSNLLNKSLPTDFDLILLIGLLGTNFSESLIGIQIFSLNKLHLKTLSAKWHLFTYFLSYFPQMKLIYKTWVMKTQALSFIVSELKALMFSQCFMYDF